MEKVRQKNLYSGCGKHLDSVGVKMSKKYHICVCKKLINKIDLLHLMLEYHQFYCSGVRLKVIL